MYIYKIVKYQLDKFDAYDLLKEGAPKDEFEAEAQFVSNQIKETTTVDQLSKIMAEVYRKSFNDQKINEKDFLLCAENVMKTVFENNVIEFFTNYIPKTRSYLNKMCYLYNEGEHIGFYVVFENYLVPYLEDAVINSDFNKIEEFFNIYYKFYLKYGKEYEKLYKETIQSFTSVALFENIDEFDNKDKIIELLPLQLKKFIMI